MEREIERARQRVRDERREGERQDTELIVLIQKLISCSYWSHIAQ